MYKKQKNSLFLRDPLTCARLKWTKGKEMLPLVLANLYWPALAGILAQHFQMIILNFPLEHLLFDIDHLILLLMSSENREKSKLLLNNKTLYCCTCLQLIKSKRKLLLFTEKKIKTKYSKNRILSFWNLFNTEIL